MKGGPFGKRRAISPVLATVILIAITLVSGVSMAGFSFGLFGTLSGNASVTAIGVQCVANSAADSACAVTLRNTGNAGAAVVSCSLSGATSAATGSTTVPAGTSSSVVTCTGAPMTTLPGQVVQGTISLSNGVAIPFSGIYV